MRTMPLSIPQPVWSTEGASAPAPAATITPTQTEIPAAPQDWNPYVPDTTKSPTENLALKAAHDATAPKGHDPNTPFKAPAPAAPAASAAPAPANPQIQFSDLAIPDGYQLDQGLGTELIQTITQNLSDPKGLANALIKLQVSAQEKARESESRDWDATVDGWKKATEADPEIGGAKYTATTTAVKQVLDRFGGPALQEMLTLTGVGSHPEFQRLLSKIAPFVTEAPPVLVASPIPAADRPTSTNLYPAQGKS